MDKKFENMDKFNGQEPFLNSNQNDMSRGCCCTSEKCESNGAIGDNSKFGTMENFDNMDKLDKIFFMQALFDNDIIEKRNLQGIAPEQWIQKQTLAMISELAELLDEVNFKWWKNPKELIMANIKEELIDILHFFVGMCERVGMTSNEMFEIYMKKNQENFDRQYGKSLKKGYELEKK